MSTLTLVRHGQATPFEKVTDRLSEAGREQSRLLAQYWQRHGIRFSEVVRGSLERHRQTAEELGIAEDAKVDPGWNEYAADGILHLLTPVLASRDAAFARLVAASEEARGGPDRNRHFQRMMEVLMDAWLAGEVEAEGAESFAAFQSRVVAALRSVREGPSGRDVLVITSGGPIGLCVQQALGAPDKAFLDVNWRMRNTGITEFTFSATRFTLDTLNGLPHLVDERQLWTWR